jgi:hypothetical protein
MVNHEKKWTKDSVSGSFIGGALGRYFKDKGTMDIRALDKKPLPDKNQRVLGMA